MKKLVVAGLFVGVVLTFAWLRQVQRLVNDASGGAAVVTAVPAAQDSGN